MRLHRQAHTVYKAQYHIVWVARFRRKILTPGVASYLRIKLHEVRQYYPDWYFTAIGGRQRPCASAHGDSAPVQREQGGEHTEKQHQSRTSCKVWFSRQGVLGWRRNLGQGVLCVHGRCQ